MSDFYVGVDFKEMCKDAKITNVIRCLENMTFGTGVIFTRSHDDEAIVVCDGSGVDVSVNITSILEEAESSSQAAEMLAEKYAKATKEQLRMTVKRFKEICKEVVAPKAAEISRKLEEFGAEGGMISFGKDGYIRFSIYGCDLEMTRMNDKSGFNICGEYREEVEGDA